MVKPRYLWHMYLTRDAILNIQINCYEYTATIHLLLSLHLPTHSYIYPPTYYLFIYISTHPSTHLSIHHPSLYPSIYPSTHQSIHLSTSICSLPIISIHKFMFVHSSAYNLSSIYPPNTLSIHLHISYMPL